MSDDKVPPRTPFGAPGERTIIRPNPGGRRPVEPLAAGKPSPQTPTDQSSPRPTAPAATPYVPPSKPGNPSPDEWIVSRDQAAPSQVQSQAPVIAIDELVAPNENPILRSAGPLLLLLGRLRVALRARHLRT